MISGQFESCRTDTTKTTNEINTFGLRRATPIHEFTFIYVDALTVVIESKAFRAIAFIRSNCIHTLAMAPVVRHALIYIHTGTIVGQIQFEAPIAEALRESIQRFTYMRTAAVLYRTRVRNGALFPIVGQPIASGAVAITLHAARRIQATLFTLTIFGGAFVNVEACNTIVAQPITIWATTTEFPLDILTEMRTIASIPFTFVHARH